MASEFRWIGPGTHQTVGLFKTSRSTDQGPQAIAMIRVKTLKHLMIELKTLEHLVIELKTAKMAKTHRFDVIRDWANFGRKPCQNYTANSGEFQVDNSKIANRSTKKNTAKSRRPNHHLLTNTQMQIRVKVELTAFSNK